MRTPLFYGMRWGGSLLMWAVAVMILASTHAISEVYIFPFLTLGWGIATLVHAYAIQSSMPIPFRLLPAWKAFSFSDKRTIIGLYAVGIFLLGFTVFTGISI